MFYIKKNIERKTTFTLKAIQVDAEPKVLQINVYELIFVSPKFVLLIITLYSSIVLLTVSVIYNKVFV